MEVVGSRYQNPDMQNYMQGYVDTLKREVNTTCHLASTLTTVFFGGGTPSLIAPSALENLLEHLDNQIGIHPAAEISMEVDPGTFNREKLQSFKDRGVNRFSVGVQSFNDQLLRTCGRSHGIQQVEEAINDISAVQPASWSMDLICGLPKLDIATWEHSLDRAIQAGPDHVAVYDLQIEEKTPFARWYVPGSSPLPTNTAAADMYELASSKLGAAGFEHYEISNYAKPGHRCAHNMVYWSMEPFHAFGVGAASYIAGSRFHRPKNIREYTHWVDELGCNGMLQIDEPSEQLPTEDRLLETVMLRLRLSDGLDLMELSKEFGEPVREKVCCAATKFVENGFLEKISSKRDVMHNCDWSQVQSIRLRDPNGFLVANEVISDIFAKIS